MKKLAIGIGAKIFIGFIALIIIGVVIGVAGYFSLSRVTSAGSINDLSSSVQQKILEARMLEKEYPMVTKFGWILSGTPILLSY